MKYPTSTFQLNSTTWLSITSVVPEEELFTGDWVTIYLHISKTEKFRVYFRDCAICAYNNMVGGLESLLEGKREDDPTLPKDFGLLFHQVEYSYRSWYALNKYNDAESPEDLTPDVSHYELFEGHTPFPKLTTWLYSKKGTFCLKVTPALNWPTIPKKHLASTYKEFVDTYRILALVELDRKAIQRWLKRARYMVNKLLKNTEDEREREKQVAETQQTSL